MPPADESLLRAETLLIPHAPNDLSVTRLRRERRESPDVWSPARITALAALSAKLLRDRVFGREPAVVALGFWLRPASLHELRQTFPAESGTVRVPTGIVLHVTPANVDTMFVYSWALSFLAGNVNIVRLTSQRSPLMLHLLELMRQVFDEHPAAVEGNYFVTYGHEDEATARISALCDLRIVWGGDETVSRLRSIPLNPHAAERSFASKRSVAVIKAQAYLDLEEEERRAVAVKMTGDLLPFAQMACSSPHQVFWIGDGASEAIPDFAQYLEESMGAKSSEADLGMVVRRLNASFSAAAAGQLETFSLGMHSATLLARDPASSEQRDPCGSGLLVHAHCDSFDRVLELMRQDHQTMSYFGLDTTERLALAVSAGKLGVDRVVPMGQALGFTPHWDGFSLWADLTRAVVVS